ncbi:hypothetical protein FJT64_006440 [Amphibalanus amphitrite]|uniref:Uncharacterized protein n=1 Tax=Amphibalanus amphitrite TaxID=1232801 RepID=A0A6A4VX02_AMPAM|nr:uncharacterized protein LOC122366228 [Amphibalanus amphitrite]KAF0296114.1 hypothetical protein FJT64_006440 [Amphibalanus amphitrite]
MELQSAVKLLIVGQALALAAAAVDNSTETEELVFNTTTYSASAPSPELFKVGGDRIDMEAEGCFNFGSMLCCYNTAVPDSLSAARVCQQFSGASCCYLLPGRDQYPRLPADLVPLLPTLTQSGQCEQRRRGRRVLHCCRGAEPSDPNPDTQATRICTDVGDMRCCYHPFAGIDFGVVIRGSTENGGSVLGVSVKSGAEE